MKSILLPILGGLAAAQVLGTLFVRESNLDLLGKVKTLAAAGWMTIPTGAAVNPLADMQPALLGGVFYTLSAGTGLAMLTWALVFLYTRILGRPRFCLYILLACWNGLLVMVNANGPALYPSLFVLAVPPVTVLLMPDVKPSLLKWGNRPKPSWLPLLTLVLLTGLWCTQLNEGLFIAIRDHVLLSNPVGRSVNDFYYRYTLYAAEAFKSFKQKTIKTCILEGYPAGEDRVRLERLLARRDILTVAGTTSADLHLSRSNAGLVLASPHGEKIAVNITGFFKNPKPWLDKFANRTDRFKGFRRLVLAGLLVGFPCLLFVTVYSLLCAIGACFLSWHRATQVSLALCLVIGVGLFVPMLQGRSHQVRADRLGEALEDTDWPERVAALRYIETHKIEIAGYRQYRRLLHSPMVVERYWLARALAVSHDPSTYGDLLSMMDDPHPNVVCQVFYALGERGNPAAVQIIMAKMRSYGHWYAQWYGYRAIRRLGWHQTPSKQAP